MNTKNVILYIRVSTDEQAEAGYSLSYQKNRLIEYCQKKKILNYELIEDDGYSGKNSNRLGYKKILSDIKKNKMKKLLKSPIVKLIDFKVHI